MALDGSKTRVALTGQVIVQDVTDPDPTDLTTRAGTDLGYTTADGVSFEFDVDVEEIDAWQSMDPLRKIRTKAPKTVSFTLRQLQRETWLATLGGTVTETATGSGLYTWEPDESTSPTKKVTVYFDDGDISYGFIFRRCEQSGKVEMNLVRDDAVNLPNEWSVLAGPAGKKSWSVITNDPAFAASAPVGG